MNSVGSIILYAIIALVMVVCSVLTVTTRKILRAATYLLFTLFGAAVLYFMLGYEFLGGVQIAVYAGGIVVLFVFAILLTGKPADNAERLTAKSTFLGVFAALAMLGVGAWALFSRVSKALTFAGENPDKFSEMPSEEVSSIGEQLLSSGKLDDFGNLLQPGYLLPFEAISVLLLACIIGGVVIARKR